LPLNAKFNTLLQNLTHKITIWHTKTDITHLFYLMLLLKFIGALRLKARTTNSKDSSRLHFQNRVDQILSYV